MINSGESELTISDGGAKWKDGKVQESAPLTLDSKVRLLRHGIIRYMYVTNLTGMVKQ